MQASRRFHGRAGAATSLRPAWHTTSRVATPLMDHRPHACRPLVTCHSGTKAHAVTARSEDKRHAETEEERWPFNITREVNWGDLDSFNHVNNVVYLRWFETIRCEQALQLGIDLSPTAKQSLILAESNCRYLSPIEWPDTITISTRTAAIGETSWTTEFQIKSKAQGIVCATGKSRLVYFDYTTRKKISIPRELRDKINAMEGTTF